MHTAVAAAQPLSEGRVYRSDIDGVRAVAILLVVLYHTGLSQFAGGYIGVDVFFVISGWLITRQLVDQAAAGGISLVQFWARRIRRLVPAAVVMVLGTVVASAALLSPFDFRLIGLRGAAAATYLSNVLFAARAGNYFDGPLGDSPFLHTWSLSVEEQFYLFWPLLVVAVAAASKRFGADLRRLLGLTFVALIVASLTLGVVQTRTASPWAFFGLHTRAWEFAAGGLAVLAVSNRPVHMPGRAWVGAAGLAAVAVLCAVFDERTPFPGLAALGPVVATVAVLVAGSGPAGTTTSVQRILSVAPLRWLGTRSYSWYLWHWPVMVIATAALYRDNAAIRIVAAVASLGLAELSYRFVEQPFRRGNAVQVSSGSAYAVGVLSSAVAVGACLALVAVGTSRSNSEPYASYEENRQSFRDQNCDYAVSPRGHSYCVGGDLSGDRTVLLAGDSHAGQWMAAFSSVAAEMGIRTVLRSAGSCPAVLPPVIESAAERRRGCSGFAAASMDLVSELGVSTVILADADASKARLFSGPDQWREAVENQAAALAAAGVRVGLVVDAPVSNDPLLCLSRGRDEAQCTPNFAEATELSSAYASSVAALVDGGSIVPFDVSDTICSDGTCRLTFEGAWIFGASGHLTRAFTEKHLVAVGRILVQVAAGT